MTNSRRKGKVGELEAAYLLSGLFGVPVRRGQQFRGGPDSPDVVGLDGLHVEVKRNERLNLDDAMAQAVSDAGTGDVPVVVHRKSRKPWMVTFRAHDLLRFLDSAGALVDKGHAERLAP